MALRSTSTTSSAVPPIYQKAFAAGIGQHYTTPPDHLLSPDELPDRDVLVLRSIHEPDAAADDDANQEANEMAMGGIIQTALSRVATAISLTNQPDEQLPRSNTNHTANSVYPSTGDAGDIPLNHLVNNNSSTIDIPLLMLMETESGSQSLLTFAALDGPLSDDDDSSSNHHPMTILLQRFRAKGQTYTLERVYGVDDSAHNDTTTTTKSTSADESDICVICIADPSTVAVLPCRHRCLCADCAEELRSRSCFCPICRQAFHTMIRIGDISAS
ncbi:hypothetical protein SYNPS1DRAFT_27366 [Syncephalis pseudoplumigaleata]|uniref:RING-type domain-containing protein n=1 Tax=Syncephalis pseudoplumigaleata TaxID=1712513 RepID=A0A4P9Z341_9FUNG|nr:hypothetical protein SYNPS1DRAFT_27366 [Syncephalis pseudoplumigaleata]|eukprot:RKP26963.1 hypothetical protein SYNPS1DRAFT_27366 [Syncephalis pseudoplumigaleata]